MHKPRGCGILKTKIREQDPAPARALPADANTRPTRKGEVACMKLLVKLLALIAALSAAAAVIALLLAEEQRGEYISIYDHDEDELPF